MGIGYDREKNEANARLIAAAPELLAFVHAVARAAGDLDAGETIDIYDQIRFDARALVARIDGQAVR
jgi:hypothetical protein